MPKRRKGRSGYTAAMLKLILAGAAVFVLLAAGLAIHVLLGGRDQVP
jgi:hypothetical protein